jgi:hypothetical protein
MDPRDDFSIKYLKSMNLKKSFQTDLTNIIRRTTNDFTKSIFINQFEDIAADYAFDMCKEFNDKSDFITPAIRDYLIGEVCDAIQERTPNFSTVRQNVYDRVRKRI